MEGRERERENTNIIKRVVAQNIKDNIKELKLCIYNVVQFIQF